MHRSGGRTFQAEGPAMRPLCLEQTGEEESGGWDTGVTVVVAKHLIMEGFGGSGKKFGFYFK